MLEMCFLAILGGRFENMNTEVTDPLIPQHLKIYPQAVVPLVARSYKNLVYKHLNLGLITVI